MTDRLTMDFFEIGADDLRLTPQMRIDENVKFQVFLVR